MLKNRHSRPNFCVCKRAELEPLVRNGLSITPAQLEDMVSRGIPVSTANLNAIMTDDTSDNDFFISPERRRSVDPMTDSFVAAQNVRSMAKRYLKERDPFKAFAKRDDVNPNPNPTPSEKGVE